jgi:hypothetical protein
MNHRNHIPIRDQGVGPASGERLGRILKLTANRSEGFQVEVQVALFNSLRRFREERGSFRIRLARGTRVGDLVEQLAIPRDRIYVAFVNGRSVMADLGKQLEDWVELCEGDRVALSGPVPFSRAYGAPVV